MIRTYVLLLTVGVVLWLVGCYREPLEPDVDPEEFRMEIAGLCATYDPESNRVHLSWRPLDPAEEQFDCYRIYRATTGVSVATNGGVAVPEVSTDKLVSTSVRRAVPGDDSTFVDVPDVANTLYAYGIKALRIDGADTTEGILSELDTCRVGVETSFTINDGALFTATDLVTLTVNDPAGLVDSVVFTQQYTQYLVKDSTRVEVHFDDPLSPPTAEQLEQLITDTYLQFSGKLAQGVEKIAVPQFDADDPRNAQRRFSLDQGTEFEWYLKKGNGEKNVWGRLVYHNGSIDTIDESIDIAPSGNNGFIRIRMRNDMHSSEASMRPLPSDPSSYVIYKPWIDFTISIAADTTIAEQFEYWVAFTDSTASLETRISARSAWLETAPRTGRLTGIGANHNDDHVYRYSLDPATAEGAENLASLRRTYNYPNDNDIDQLPFKLRGDEPLNEIAVPGSYWGANPKRWQSTSREIIDIQETLAGTPAENYHEIVKMQRSFLFDFGRKEFVIFARFKGRYFDDVRVAASIGPRLNISPAHPNHMQTFIDFYPPKANIDDNQPLWLTNGYEVANVFGYALSSSGSVADDGHARVTTIELVVAQWPAERVWDKKTTPFEIDIEELLAYRHRILPYDVTIPKATLNDVAWRNVDASDWPSGQYVMGILTEDEYGNGGFAPIKLKMAEYTTNPWIVTIRTGK